MVRTIATLSGLPGGTVTVPFSVGGSASTPADFTLPGTTGTLVFNGKDHPTQITITARTGDAIEGVIAWTENGRKEGMSFAGTCDGDRLNWKVSKRVVGYSGRPGAVYAVRIRGTSLTASYAYPLEGNETTGTVSATLKKEK